MSFPNHRGLISNNGNLFVLQNWNIFSNATCSNLYQFPFEFKTTNSLRKCPRDYSNNKKKHNRQILHLKKSNYLTNIGKLFRGRKL